jgi:peptidoglycan hydrolase-like protein with peptidoglycan-binding domain
MARAAVAVVSLLAVGGLLMLAGGGKAHAAEGAPKDKLPAKKPDAAAADKAKETIKQVPKKPTAEDFEKLIATILKSQDPAYIRAMAEELRKRGYKYADDLLKAADSIAKELAKQNQPKPAPKPATPKPAPKPATPKPSKSVEKAAEKAAKAKREAEEAAKKAKKKADAKALKEAAEAKRKAEAAEQELRRLESERLAAFAVGKSEAQTLTLHLQNKAKGREDQTMVKNFQQAHGLESDGRYGPKTATEIASFGVVPVTPFYWPADHMQAKKDYRAVLTDAARQYPDKADQFAVALRKVV